MESSPLTQQGRPSSFQPKIDSLYEQLFQTDVNEPAEFADGFWREFFLLRPDKSSLQRRLEHIDADGLLQIQVETQQLFRRAVAQITSRNGLSDETALDTLTVFLGVVLAKRYTNPSSEIITVLAGLDEVDDVFLDFANAIETVIRSGESGLLANYNKFEFRNPYRSRLEDFVNNTAIEKVVRGLGAVCSRSRDRYVAIQEDIEEGWTLSSTLKYIGLGALAPSRSSTPNPSPEDTKDQFAPLQETKLAQLTKHRPEPDASILLPTYDFTTANKLFSSTLITLPAPPKSESPFSAFLSLTSYILHHAHRSPRATLYGLLNLTTLRILIEDQTLCAKLFDPTLSTPVRLCRQRQPFLPSTPNHPRPLAAAILDIALDTINHNLRRRLHIPLYTATLNILHRLLAYLVTTRSRLPYHWPLLWQTLLSLLRFLTTYSASLVHDPDLPALIDILLTTLSLAVGAGDVFLPDTAAYDDLFYKLVESAHLLPRFRSSFGNLSRHSSSSHSSSTTTTTSPAALVNNLISTSRHFETLLDEEKGKGKVGRKNLAAKEVGGVIRAGVESLPVPDVAGLEKWGRWREVEERAMVKRAGRCAVEDARRVVGG
ncbi:MAG: hypothetical protein Q9216_007073 [Gyalolechia sp. 2 TL-2023]